MECSASLESEHIIDQGGVGFKETSKSLRYDMQYIDTFEIEQPIGLRETVKIIQQLEVGEDNCLDEVSSITSCDLALSGGDMSEIGPVFLGVSVNPTGKTVEEQLKEYNERSVAAGFPDLSHLHRPLSYFERQQKRLAWEQLQQKEHGTECPGEGLDAGLLVPIGIEGSLTLESIDYAGSMVYYSAEDTCSDFSTSLTEYRAAVSDQKYDEPRFVSFTIPDIATQILETQKGGTIYTCNKGIRAAQSRGRLILSVGAAANDSPRSDSSASTVDGFPDAPF